jgi:hypothetical protein
MSTDPFSNIIQQAWQKEPVAIAENHHERIANTTQNRPYFQIGDRVGLKHDWFSLGVVEQIRPKNDSFEYHIAWLDFDNNLTGKKDWNDQSDLTL